MKEIDLFDIRKNNYSGFYQTVLKRVVDLICSIILLPIVLIVTVFVFVALKLDDGGPVFYRSKRIGKGFKEFDMLKFRSMKVNAPDIRNSDGSTFNSSDDKRVTKVGHFLRETSLDEIPQLFNIIKGDMSLVGPRAGDVESKDTYKDDEKGKMLIRPGITGYTQAYYRNSIPVRDKRLLDAWYAHNVTMWLDIKILFKTVATVFKHDNLYTNVPTEKEEKVPQEVIHE